MRLPFGTLCHTHEHSLIVLVRLHTFCSSVSRTHTHTQDANCSLRQIAFVDVSNTFLAQTLTLAIASLEQEPVIASTVRLKPLAIIGKFRALSSQHLLGPRGMLHEQMDHGYEQQKLERLPRVIEAYALFPSPESHTKKRSNAHASERDDHRHRGMSRGHTRQCGRDTMRTNWMNGVLLTSRSLFFGGFFFG